METDKSLPVIDALRQIVSVNVSGDTAKDEQHPERLRIQDFFTLGCSVMHRMKPEEKNQFLYMMQAVME